MRWWAGTDVSGAWKTLISPVLFSLLTFLKGLLLEWWRSDTNRFKPPNTMDHPLEQWIGSTACVLDYSTIWHLFYLYLNHTNISQTNCCKYSISCISAVHILEFKLAFLSIICLSKLLVWSMNYCLHAVNHNVLIWQLMLNILWLAERGTLKPLDEF